MGKTILFSPIGGTDPIAEKNMQDGSLLHICRVYRPDKVVMYMSREMLEKHRKDNRYLECLDRLAKLQNREMEYVIIERPELQYVQKYDYFYPDFHAILSELSADMQADDTLLLNVSSGTPAMKSGLLVLQTLGEFPAKMIQVRTPTGKMNEHEHSKEYDLDDLWELNEDNQENFVNRCDEIHCPTLSDLMKKQIIRKHVEVYDYRAARSVADTLTGSGKEDLIRFLQFAESRYLLEHVSSAGFQCGSIRFDLPVRDGKYRQCFEYALSFEIRLKRGEYADYIRALTPLLVDLFDLVLQKQCGIRAEMFCRNTPNGLFWSRSKLEGTELEKVFQEKYGLDFFYGAVNSDSLLTLLLSRPVDIKLKEAAKSLREVEVNIRNLAAHEIVSINEARIEKLTGCSGKQIMQLVKRVFSYSGINARADAWESYEKMNQRILYLLDQT